MDRKQKETGFRCWRRTCMLRFWPVALAVLALACALAHGSALSADVQLEADAQAEYDGGVLPLLEKFCFDCHQGAEASAGLTLEHYRPQSAATTDRHVWAKVLSRIEGRLNQIRERVRGLPRPQTLLVFERSPQTLRGIYVSGGTGFLNEMLDYAGGANVFADVRRESVQPSQETLLTRAPQVILEVRASQTLSDADARRDRDVWNALPSLPAVRQRRVHFLTGSTLVVPGPRVAEGVELMARALHPDAFR